jgi:type VI secretion system secreted protein VgrG
MSHGVRPGALAIRDHNFRNPDYAFLVEAPRARAPEDLYEQYHYRPGTLLFEGGAGGDTPVADDKGVARHDEPRGRERAARELAAERAGKRQISFETNVIDLLPGAVFAIQKHPHSALAPGHPLLVTEFYLDGSPGGSWRMSGRAFFAEEPFTPALVTPRPKVLGLESATVVGPPGEEIHVDEFGRVRVQFPWDREGKRDDKSSCWMRVSQGAAGMGFGMMSLPRVGQEVLVGFLGGDPDQPIIVGRVYNGKNTVPFKLPEHKTVSTWKSASTPGGDGFNEILFDDARSRELVYVQAQKDLRKLVKHDEAEVTQGHQTRLVGGDQDSVVKGVKKERIEGESHVHVMADQRWQVEGKESITIGGSRHETIGQSHALEAGQEIHLKAGTSVVIEAMNLTLKDFTGNFIHIGPGGVDIVGTFVKINSGGMAGSGGGASPDAPSEAAEAVVEPPDAPRPSA